MNRRALCTLLNARTGESPGAAFVASVSRYSLLNVTGLIFGLKGGWPPASHRQNSVQAGSGRSLPIMMESLITFAYETENKG